MLGKNDIDALGILLLLFLVRSILSFTYKKFAFNKLSNMFRSFYRFMCFYLGAIFFSFVNKIFASLKLEEKVYTLNELNITCSDFRKT